MSKKLSKKRQKWRQKLIKQMMKSGGYHDNIVLLAQSVERYIFAKEKPNTTQK